MIRTRLTRLVLAATTCAMKQDGQQAAGGPEPNSRRAWGAAGVLAGCATVMGLGGCVSVSAPDKPIVIELNINIKQEVVYRLAADAARTIEDNPDIF